MFERENSDSKNFSSPNIEELSLRARNGDVVAAHDLAVAYEDGDYVAQDFSQALTWYRRSAEGGNADSKFRLGRIFHFGLTGEVEYEEAVKWYQQAIADGHLLAKVNLGRMYVAGEGVEQNYKAAESLFLEAGLEGDRDAQNSLGNRAKESLLVDFIHQTDLDQIGDKASVIEAFFTFAQAAQQREAEDLINEENLNAEAAKRYITASLKREFASDSGTELNTVLPKMSPLNPQYLTKKQTVFQKIAAFVEKFKGVGGQV